MVYLVYEVRYIRSPKVTSASTINLITIKEGILSEKFESYHYLLIVCKDNLFLITPEHSGKRLLCQVSIKLHLSQ